jgi:hypothetical protein
VIAHLSRLERTRDDPDMHNDTDTEIELRIQARIPKPSQIGTNSTNKLIRELMKQIKINLMETEIYINYYCHYYHKINI